MARCFLIGSKICGFMHLPQHILEIVVIIETPKNLCESFTGLKPNLNKMHIFSTTCFCYIQSKQKLKPHSEKGIFVGYDKQSPTYLIYFPETEAIKRVRHVKFTNSYDNSPLPESEDEQMVLSDYINNTYKEKCKDNYKTEEEGQIHHYPTRQRKKPDFFVVENF